jgi:hypothetical protein
VGHGCARGAPADETARSRDFRSTEKAFIMKRKTAIAEKPFVIMADQAKVLLGIPAIGA